MGQALIGIRKRMRFFKEAILLQGPLLQDEFLTELPEMMQLLEQLLREQGVSRVEMNPYLIEQVLDESLSIVADHRYQSLIDRLEALGYVHELDLESTRSLGQMFRKNLTVYESVDSLYQDFTNNIAREIRKATEAHISVRELSYDELGIFNDILEVTAERKGFPKKSLEYFQLVKQAFGEKAKFMLASLDREAYQAYYEERIQYFTDRIEMLESAERLSKKTKGLITDAKDQLASYEKRKKNFEALEVDTSQRYIPVSSYVFICYGDEVLSWHGGSYEEYLAFGGSTLLNWHMICYAFENGYDYYNFYGTIETDLANKNQGNFQYKRQFGGELDVLVGLFNKTWNPLMKVIERVKS